MVTDLEMEDEEKVEIIGEGVDRLNCSDKELNDLHRAEMRQFYHTYGWYCNSTKMPEYWELTNRHVAEHQARIDARTKTELRERRASAKAESDSTPVKSGKETIKVKVKAENHCLDCNVVIPPSGKRGRPATRCNDCKAKLEQTPTGSPVVRKPGMVKAPTVKICLDCDTEIPPTGQRGRRPDRCPVHQEAHRAAVEAEKLAKRTPKVYPEHTVSTQSADQVPFWMQ